METRASEIREIAAGSSMHSDQAQSDQEVEAVTFVERMMKQQVEFIEEWVLGAFDKKNKQLIGFIQAIPVRCTSKSKSTDIVAQVHTFHVKKAY